MLVMFMKINPTKVKKMSGILRIVINVFFWAAIVVGMIFVITCCAILFAPSDILRLINSGSMSISLVFNGMISYKVNPGSMHEMAKLKEVLLAFVPTVILGAAMFAIFLKHRIRLSAPLGA
jgi:hypothetical protein